MILSDLLDQLCVIAANDADAENYDVLLNDALFGRRVDILDVTPDPSGGLILLEIDGRLA